ncbi:molybdopterin-guanine dinucleotide biosynthesis protein A [Aneurinibacillus soli]|uniref:Probable molybdenum cofactor guanylyltransferase n=1 Tax=Aneurinibacillus soli TaxID=1500254 RepID=A0A0U5B1B5_9BACL|nr:molybdenum cofactor guanylyltransferase [Aneurinibacillus soli]PYE61772.1 molybdopterin-guanine dinucleotide biosynthesis protein A [Aneurinibacillus soli]BAU28370.1 Molybdenum cofactor guanylyltransferase [Aneurinibacillus soli]
MIQGVILAGGKSSRMGGQPKELLPVKGEPLIVRTCRLLQQTVQSCLIISNHAERLTLLPPSVSIYPDDIKEQGPLGGIATAMRVSSHDLLLVVGCDMPELNEDILCELALYAPKLKSGQLDAVVPKQADGRLQPLCALYHRRILPVILNQLSTENKRMRTMLDAINVADLPVQQDSTQVFYNLNTPADYETFRKEEIR